VPLDWALLCCILSSALLIYAMHVRSRNEEFLSLSNESMTRVDDALTIVSPEVLPLMHLRARRQRALFLVQFGEPRDALAAVEVALKALDHAQFLLTSGFLHSRVLGEINGKIGGLHIALRLYLDNAGLGLEAAEGAKAALLHSMIAGGADVKSCLSIDDGSAFEDASNALRGIMYKLDCAAGMGDEYDVLLTAYVAVKSSVDSFVRIAQERSPAVGGGRQLGATLNAQQLVGFVDDSDAIAISFFFAPVYKELATGDENDVLHAFVVWNGRVHVLINRNVHDPGDGEMSDTFIDSNMSGESEDNRRRRRSKEAEYLAAHGSFINEIFYGVSNGSVPDRLIIVPHRGLHKVPFSAVPICSSSNVGAGYFSSPSATDGDDILLGDLTKGGMWTAPSLSIAARLRGRNVRHKLVTSSSVVAVTCPRLPTESQLQKVIENKFVDLNDAGPTMFEDIYACPATIKTSLDVRMSDILHISCHGIFAGNGGSQAAYLNPSQVLGESGLLFDADETQNTIPPSKLLSTVDIWSLQPAQCRLACVVSCSGGVVNTRSQSDECLSIGTAFLVAGARHVVCTLWPVSQVAAVLVMSRFYQMMCQSRSEDSSAPWHIARCLAQAQSWYRSLTPDEYSDAFDAENLTDAFPNDELHRPDNRDFYN
jgi:hypothetical protein